MTKPFDLTGRRLGKLLVIGAAPRGKHNKVCWKCKCDCGAETVVTSDSLLKKKNPTRACGCGRHVKGRGLLDLTGQRFGRLIALELGVPTKINPKRSIVFWKCGCDCGGVANVRSNDLRNGSSKSCGCLEKELTSRRSTTHGLTKDGRRSPIYTMWRNMLNRCYWTPCKKFNRYGGRGIRVCEFLRASPVNVIALIGNKPFTSATLGRPDNDGMYSCGDCAECLQKQWKLNVAWETKRQQVRNRSNTRFLTIDGITKPLAEWAEQRGVPYSALKYRVDKGLKPFGPLK